MKLLKVLLAITAIIFIYSCVDDEQFIDESILETEERQAVVGGVTLPLCVEITVFIDPTCNQNWIDGTTAAITAYNNLAGVAINMTQVFQAPADISIDCSNYVGDPFIALGEWPEVDNTIGGQVFINNAHTNDCPGDPCWYQGVMMHELGHNLGMAHGEQENSSTLNSGPWAIDPATGGVLLDAMGNIVNATPGITVPGAHIAGTANGAGDANSVFNAAGPGPCATPICTFSADDILALQTLYPCAGCSNFGCECPITPTITGPNSFCVGDEATFCVTGIAQGWSLSTGAGICFDVSFPDPGIQTISVEVCPDGLPDCCVSASIEVEVREKKDGIKCICVCEAQEQSGRDNPIELWEVEVDCCDDRPCSELIPDWWIEYLIDDRECFKKEEIIPEDPEIPCEIPNVSLSGPYKICLGESGTYCITGINNGSTTWQISGVGSITTSTDCLTFTPQSIGNYKIRTTICKDGCCETFFRNVEVTTCEVECYCQCKNNQGDITELIYDCNEIGDCQDIFFEEDIYDCRQLTRIR